MILGTNLVFPEDDSILFVTGGWRRTVEVSLSLDPECFKGDPFTSNAQERLDECFKAQSWIAVVFQYDNSIHHVFKGDAALGAIQGFYEETMIEPDFDTACGILRWLIPQEKTLMGSLTPNAQHEYDKKRKIISLMVEHLQAVLEGEK